MHDIPGIHFDIHWMKCYTFRLHSIYDNPFVAIKLVIEFH